LNKPSGRFWLLAAVAAVGLVVLQQVWHWEVERIEVPPGKFLVRIHRWGKNLPEDEIVARDASYKGVMLDVLGEGRHFLNPIFWTYESHNIKEVPAGKCLVLTRKFGTKIPDDRMAQGDILARQNKEGNPFEGERGILRDVLPPGSYRINPHAYSVEEIEAVEIGVHQVGVRTLKVGDDPRGMPRDQSLGSYVVADGYRGVQKSTVPPGTYYINPHAETITPVDVRAHRVELQDIQFPSRDGFILKPRVVVEYAAIADKTPEMVARLADDGRLHQADGTLDEQQQNEILQKVLLPHIRGYARIEGSNFDARDFILSKTDAPAAAGEAPADNAREKMQTELLKKVKPRCEVLGVELRAATLAAFQPPAELAQQIALRELARVEREKNEVLVRQHKAQQELAAKQGLKQQATEKVGAETRLIQAKTKLDQSKEVEESRLKQDLANAKIELEAARSEAEAKLATGKAQADVIGLQNQAEISGLKTAVQGFSSVDHFAQYHVLSKLTPALSEIFASDDSEFARLFAAYMAQQPGTNAKMPRSTSQANAVVGPARSGAAEAGAESK
jgi:hypothetical protein